MAKNVNRAKDRATFAVIGALGIAAATIPYAVYRLIETAGGGGMPAMRGMTMSMDCQDACAAAAAVGAAVAAVAIAAMFFKSIKLRLGGSIALLAGGAAVIAVPRIAGFCESAGMACRYITEPTLAILGGAIIALSAVRTASAALALRKAPVSP
ncbi:MAG: DUF4418 family protein [Oscillospiraceae bacterium]|jgi:hypothetical protein|nr:DUF4418 family protein [Oscillospiraceae bacterium]